MISILLIAGCAKTPTIYTMDPILIEKARSEIETVGVSLSPNYPKTQILLPAKIDRLVKSRNFYFVVVPAKAGIQYVRLA